MQAKPFITFPPSPPPPSQITSTKSPPVNQPPLSPANTVPRAISISTPDTRVTVPIPMPVPVPPTIELDDSIAAFWDYQFLFVSQRQETTQPVTLRVVDGAIPADFPSGTYYLTGPGLFSDDHGSTVHPLDGHGYLRAFSIDNVSKKVKYMAKYVKTEAQVEEHDPKTDTWRFTHRGPFSVLKGGRKVGNTKVMKNVANTCVLRWGDKLLCFWEGGEPYEIEFGTLDTVGRFDMMDMDGCDLNPAKSKLDGDAWEFAAGLLKPILYGVFKMPPRRLLSHYKVDASRNRLLTVSCNAEDMLLPRSNFTFCEYDSKFKVVQKQEFKIPDHLMIHDWAFTDSHYIIFANRIKLDVLGSMGAVCGVSPMISALTVNPSQHTSPIYLLPRFPNSSSSSSSSRDWTVPVQAPSQLWFLHVANAYEVNSNDSEGTFDLHIQASACSYQWFNFRSLFGYNWQRQKLDPSIMNVKEGENELPHLVQVSIKLDSDHKCEECSVKQVKQWKKASDFPVINPSFSGKKNRYVYAATTLGRRKALPHFPFDTVVKLDLSSGSVQTWSVGARRFVGEPIFVPTSHHSHDGEEDDGYLLVVEYAVAMQRCYLVILNTKKIGASNAVVARIEIPRNLNFPLGFHGFWAPENKF
ncbi:hypothetical protein K1719_039553 [Acacia pycnantha]|nr:hypothetical protein K1719_039553 [Acacia pycnantha]